MTVHEPIAVPGLPRPYRFSQADYALLSDHGAFDRYAKTELVEGVILAVNARYSRHARVQSLLLRLLGAACDDIAGDLGAWVELSIAAGERSMPRPDIVVTRGLPDSGPVPLDSVALIIEVADSSLDADLNAKAAFYARLGIAEYWVADADHRIIHQLCQSDGQAYGLHREIAFGTTIDAVTIPELTIETARL